jgi:putative transposase
MPDGLKRYQNNGDMHFVTFSCHDRKPYLGTDAAKHAFLISLEAMRRKYRFCVTGYVLMPDHVHLLLTEPDDAFAGNDASGDQDFRFKSAVRKTVLAAQV